MAVVKTIFVCQNCGYQSVRWLGRCPDCNSWNSLLEEQQMELTKTRLQRQTVAFEEPKQIAEIELDEHIRTEIGINELDRILGGGVVVGSVILVGGEPGIGKSTLLLQASNFLSQKGKRVLYVSGEESARQTKLRAQRIGAYGKDLYIVNETNTELIIEHIKKLTPQVVIIDSIQIVYSPQLSSSPGSVSQVRDCANLFTNIAKSNGVILFLVSHVTKEGSIAGPKVLEHIVDTVLYFEGERHTNFRILRAVKNRFGSTNEIGVFNMSASGLVEVANPSELLLSERASNSPGCCVTVIVEGSRPLLIELQALTSRAAFSVPRQKAMGLDYNRLSLLIAVLEKRANLDLFNQDVFVNVAGGLKITEPASDLAVCVSIYSSFKNIPTNPDGIIVGEVGLAGEVRSVSQIETRINEAGRLGFKHCVIPKGNLKGLLNKIEGLKLTGVETINEALELGLKNR